MKNSFVTKKVNSLTLGEMLQQTREEANFSLKEIAKKTKIQVKYLESLEKGRYDQLPADVYVKGFLKEYLRLLGFNYKDALRLYRKERQLAENLRQKEAGNISEIADSSDSFNQTKSRRFSSLVVTPKMITLALICLAILGGCLYFWYQVSSFVKDPQLVLDNPSSNLTIRQSSILFSGQTEKDINLTINGEPVYLDKEGKFNEIIILQEGLNTIEVKAINRLKKITTIIRQIISQK